MAYSKQRLREIAELKRTAVERILSEIGELDVSLSHKYIEEFSDEFQTFEDVSDSAEVMDAAGEKNLIWIGDYHALASSQLYAAAFIKTLAVRNANIAVAVEPVFSRSQKTLDDWHTGRIDEKQFLDRIRYDEEWGCEWSGYKAIFDAARNVGAPVYGVDCHPRYDMRSIGRRDQGAARSIARLIEQDPLRTLVVVFGESHLASSHLPRRVRQILTKKSLEARELLVLQNNDNIYWQLQEKGHEAVSAVRLSNQQYCVFNATPIEKYESFRQYLQRCIEEDASGDWTRFAHNIVSVLLDFFDIKERDAVVDYIPVPGDGLPLASATERFARFIHQACRGEFARPSNRSAYDRFFVVAIENALAYFCSKLLDSSRDGIESLAERVFPQLEGNDKLARSIGLLIDPAKKPGSRHFAVIRDAVEAGLGSQKTSNQLCQLLGYGLGRRIYQAYLESRISRKEIHDILHDPLDAPQRPLQCYIELTQRVAL
jgi:hypothetical protein